MIRIWRSVLCRPHKIINEFSSLTIACALTMVKKAVALVFLFYYFLQAGCMKKRLRESHWNSFSSSRIKLVELSTEVMFLLPRAAKIKDLSIQRIYSRIDLDDKFILFCSEQNFGWNYCSCWTKFKTMGEFRFVELFSPKIFNVYEKISEGSTFNFECI